MAGIANGLFIFLLNFAHNFRTGHQFIIFGLPFIGFLITWCYFTFAPAAEGGNNLIIDEIHQDKNSIPFKMAPLIMGSTFLTHLFGGPTGREGAALQIGASLADQISKVIKIDSNERKTLLKAGLAAGLASITGAPLAGAVFGMEVVTVRKFNFMSWYECLVAAFVAYFTTLIFGMPHISYPKIITQQFEFKTIFWVSIVGIIFALAGKIFVEFTHIIEKLNNRFLPYPPVRPFITGIILLVIYYTEGSFRYIGLGLEQISEALSITVSWKDPIYKTLLSGLALGAGFKGGEFIPLVFIGSTLGNSLSAFIPLSHELLASLGFVAIFAGVSRTPLALAILAAELFGYAILPYALLVCFISFYFAGPSGIYKGQKD